MSRLLVPRSRRVELFSVPLAPTRTWKSVSVARVSTSPDTDSTLLMHTDPAVYPWNLESIYPAVASRRISRAVSHLSSIAVELPVVYPNVQLCEYTVDIQIEL